MVHFRKPFVKIAKNECKRTTVVTDNELHLRNIAILNMTLDEIDAYNQAVIEEEMKRCVEAGPNFLEELFILDNNCIKLWEDHTIQSPEPSPETSVITLNYPHDMITGDNFEDPASTGVLYPKLEPLHDLNEYVLADNKSEIMAGRDFLLPKLEPSDTSNELSQAGKNSLTSESTGISIPKQEPSEVVNEHAQTGSCTESGTQTSFVKCEMDTQSDDNEMPNSRYFTFSDNLSAGTVPNKNCGGVQAVITTARIL